MNRKRRERLKSAVELLEAAGNIVSLVCDEEEDSMDNYPENLQGTDRYERLEDSVDRLNDAISGLDEVVDLVRAAM